MEHLSEMAQLSIRPQQLNSILLKFKESQEVRIIAKSFLCD